MSRYLRNLGASTLGTAFWLSCGFLAACLQGSTVTAAGGVGGSGGGDASASSGGFDTSSSGSGGEPTSSDPASGGNMTTGPSNPGQTWSFDQNLEGWLLRYGSPKDLVTNSSMSHDGGVGSPDAGSIHLSIPFDGTGQKLAIAVAVMSSPGLNLVGRTVTAKVTLGSGLSTNDGKGGYGVVKLYVKSGDALVYADSGAETLVPGTWQDLTLTADSPSAAPVMGYDASDIREIGIEVSTAGMGSFATADLHVDTVGYD